MPNIPGIDKVRTIKRSGSASMPPNMDQPYINMFVLSKEKERLEKEGMKLDTRREVVVGRLKDIEKEMERLQRQEKKVQKKRKFDPDTTWVKVKKENNPEEPKKPKIEPGWKIKAINTRKQKL